MENKLQPDTLAVVRCSVANFPQVTTYWGFVVKNIGSSGKPSDHSTGRAVDIMIPNYRPYPAPLGEEIALFYMNNAAAFGVKYIIWSDRIWRAGEPITTSSREWRNYRYPGAQNDTTAHRDHVHVSVYGDAGTGGAGAGSAVGAGGWAAPIGVWSVTSNFGYRIHPISGTRKMHAGTDFRAATGTPIFAAGPGVAKTQVSGGYGNLVTIDHGGGVSTRYAHNSAFRVSNGQQVQAGQVVALAGSTGASTGPHLHFEVRLNGAATDPVAFLSGRGVSTG